MNSVRIHIGDVLNSQPRHDLPISVNDIVILRGFYFRENFPYAKFCENKTLTKISEFTVFNENCFKSSGDIEQIKTFYGRKLTDESTLKKKHIKSSNPTTILCVHWRIICGY